MEMDMEMDLGMDMDMEMEMEMDMDMDMDLEMEMDMEMDLEMDNPVITRVEVIDPTGRVYINWKPSNIITYDIQDDGRTLKIFIKQKENDTVINDD
jgi:hypothetical protein